jgi:hypothetical protein
MLEKGNIENPTGNLILYARVVGENPFEPDHEYIASNVVVSFLRINNSLPVVTFPPVSFKTLEEMILEVPKSQLPFGMPLEVGTQLAINLANGGQIPAVMTAVSEETVTIDANHPLAGKDLVFEVQLVEINPKKSGLIFFE